MTWLDIGNGWRNLYLLSCVVQAGALGALFCQRRWFCKKSRAACFLTGVAATPFVQYLWTLLLALAWPAAPRLAYIGALPALGTLCLLVMALRRIRRAKALLGRGWAFLRRVCHFDKPALMSCCFALCMAILLLPVCVRLATTANIAHGGDMGEYLGLALRFCEDRDAQALFEKEETEGHFRGHSHFPSLELYLSYGLFHTNGEVGYPNDKAAFTGLGLLNFYMAAAYLALLTALCRERKRWVLLGLLLLNLVPRLFESASTANRDIWRVLALLLAVLFYMDLDPLGGVRQYAGRLLASFAVCFTVMSTHVVCFVVLPFIVIAWVLSRWLGALVRQSRNAGKALLASAGVALAGAAGTLAAFSGNLWCYWRWGELSPWRLITTFTDAPWYSMYMDMEYRLEETTTHYSFLEAKDSILQSYATSIGDWGLRFALVTLVAVLAWMIALRLRTRREAKKRLAAMPKDGASAVGAFWVATGADKARTANLLLYAALATLLTLAPMSGVLDTSLYSFSGSFLKLPRYTLQWFLVANAMTCAALAALEGVWPALMNRARAFAARGKGPFARLPARACAPAAALLRGAPALLCAAACFLAFVDGTTETGYARSFFGQSRTVMTDERLLVDNSFQARYGMLMRVAEHVGEDQKILITRSGYQYPLHGRGYVLTTNPIVHLLNLTLEEIGPALADMNVAMLATEPGFWDERYYALSALSEYLNALPAEQIVEDENMRLYLLDASLVPYAVAED